MDRERRDRGLQDTQCLLRCYLGQLLGEGDWVIDATAGKGRDTIFLAQCVGRTGKVVAFDIQEQAIKETADLLQLHGLADRVQLNLKSHALLAETIQKEVKAVIFNLGYLPGSNKEVVTQAETTLQALKQALEILAVHGIVILTIYRGHPGATEEAEVIQDYLALLSKQDFSVIQGIYLNQGDLSPYWMMIQKNRKVNTVDENPTTKNDSRADHA